MVGNRAAPYLARHYVYLREGHAPRLLARISNTVTAGLGWVWGK